jgi:hypothetical protein
MIIKKSLVFSKFIVFAGMLLGLLSGPANSATGPVGYYFVQDYTGGQTYTFVNIGPGTQVCYHVGTSTTSAYATILASKQIAGKSVTISCDSSGKITQVAN